jgi:hypothetical protein
MAVKEPWNIYEGYSVNCDCETRGMGLNDIANWGAIAGNSIDYAYDGSGNVISATYKKDGVDQFKLIYTYDGLGNVINITTTSP